MNERQRRYLETLRATGSAPRARQAAGVVRKTVSLWERDEQFAEAAAEAVEFARDALIQRARDLAMDGSEAMLGLFVRAYTPELRPTGTQVAVGVQVNGRNPRSERIAAMTDDERLVAVVETFEEMAMRGDMPSELLARLQALSKAAAPRQARLEAPIDVVDVEPLPVASPEPAGGVIGVKEAAEGRPIRRCACEARHRPQRRRPAVTESTARADR